MQSNNRDCNIIENSVKRFTMFVILLFIVYHGFNYIINNVHDNCDDVNYKDVHHICQNRR